MFSSFGWKQKAERLRMVMLSGAHQLAKELPPGIARMLAIYAHLVKSGDGSNVEAEMKTITVTDDEKPLWEPADIYGWQIQATMYLQNKQLWWLLHATRKNEKEPSDQEIAFLDKVLDHLGCDPKRDVVIGPRSNPASEDRLPFGWWTWFNRGPLYEIQVNKDKQKDKEKMRIVPLGSRETDGYTSIDLTEGAGDEAP